ncbi:MAG: hypothetical protein AAGM27_12385, partial [Cyanobacteria bacterium J06554_3]
MKVFIAGLTLAAAVVGGGIGYASLQTGTTPVWEQTERVDSTDPKRSDTESVVDSQVDSQTNSQRDLPNSGTETAESRGEQSS